MNRWVQRGLRTALLTGGLLAAGAGVAAADENDLTTDVLGVTTTVPVREDATVGTPVVTGTGEDLAIGGDDGPSLPVDTDTEPGTTVLGQDGTGGVSVPVRVTEASAAAPDPRDGLTVTVPANTSGGGAAGTTVTAPVVTGDLGEVVDGDPLSGLEVDVDLADPVVPGPGTSGVLLDLEDTVTIGASDGTTSSDTVLALPAGLDGGRPTTVALPRPEGSGHGPLTGTTVDVRLGGLPDRDPDTGSVVTVPVGPGRTGTPGDLLVRITLPVGSSGQPGRDDDGPGSGHGEGAAPSRHPVPGAAPDPRQSRPQPDGDTGTAAGSSGRYADCGATGGTPAAATLGLPAGGPQAGAGAAPSGRDDEGPAAGEACGTGTTSSVGVRPSSSAVGSGPVVAAAGLLAVAAGVLTAVGRFRGRRV